MHPIAAIRHAERIIQVHPVLDICHVAGSEQILPEHVHIVIKVLADISVGFNRRFARADVNILIVFIGEHLLFEDWAFSVLNHLLGFKHQRISAEAFKSSV